VLDRYRQIKPKFIFTETEVLYAGKRIPLVQKAHEIVEGLLDFGVEHVVLLPSAISGEDIVRKGEIPRR
jgi:acetoacetyl-CoA synthetase